MFLFSWLSFFVVVINSCQTINIKDTVFVHIYATFIIHLFLSASFSVF